MPIRKSFGFRPDGRWKVAGVEACFEAHPPECRRPMIRARMGAGTKLVGQDRNRAKEKTD